MLFQIATAKSFAIDNNDNCSFPNLIEHLHYLNGENTYNPSLSHSLEYLNIFKNLQTCPMVGDTKSINFPFDYVDIKITNDNAVINGFFQSEKYFNHNRNEILDFINISSVEVPDKYSFNNLKTTGIHVRRGDYVNHPNHHPVQDLTYYLKGIDLLKGKTDLFIIFSDDIKWCKENIKIQIQSGFKFL